MADLLDQWMAHLEGQGRARSTLVRYRSAINANIKPALGKIDIARLEPAQIDAYYSKLLASGLTPLTVRKSHAILSASFAQALRWGWVDRSPVLRASPPKHTRPGDQPSDARRAWPAPTGLLRTTSRAGEHRLHRRHHRGASRRALRPALERCRPGHCDGDDRALDL